MLEHLTNWVIQVGDEIPIWGVIILIAFSLLFLYLLFILIRNIINIIAMATTPVARLVAGKKVEVKGILTGREAAFQSPFDDKQFAFLRVEIGYFYDDNRDGTGITKEEVLGVYQKGNELFNIKDETGEVLVAHHTFLNKVLEIKNAEYINDEMPEQLMELFPEIREHLIQHKQSFFLKIKYLEQVNKKNQELNKELMIYDKINKAEIEQTVTKNKDNLRAISQAQQELMKERLAVWLDKEKSKLKDDE